MKVRHGALCLLVFAAVACSSSSGPTNNVERGYSLSEYGTNPFVPPVISVDGHTLFGMTGSVLLSKGGTATATIQYRLDSNSGPQKSKVFTGTWTQGGAGTVIELSGATATESAINGISRIKLTASWTDSGVGIGGDFGFTRVLPE